MKLPESWVKSVENKQFFDEDLSKDSLDLLLASAALEIKEYTLFELAYRDWYGKKPLDHVIEAHFSNYMFHRQIPAWVRSFSRRIVELHEREELDPREFGVYQPLPSKRLIRIGKAFSALLVLSFVVLMIFIYRAPDMREPNTSQSLFGRADVARDSKRPSHNAMP